MKRDFIEEIESKNKRVLLNERDWILENRLGAIEAIVAYCKENIDQDSKLRDSEHHSKEFHRYIPIATIACVESFFRSSVNELIDRGEPFSGNILKSSKLKDFKVDLSILTAIEGRKISFGDLLSHLIPLRSFENINAFLGDLLNIDFLEELKNYLIVRNPAEFDYNAMSYRPGETFISVGDFTEDMRKQSSEIYESVKEMYRLRNIFCHEAADSEIVNISKIYEHYSNTVTFLQRSNLFIWDVVEPDYLITNYDMTERAAKELEQLDVELDSLLAQYNELDPIFGATMLGVQKIWIEYRDKRAEIVGSDWDNGTGRGLAFLGEKQRLTRNRIEEIVEGLAIVQKYDNSDQSSK